MPATFIHTADWHLGKPFGGIADEDKQGQVRLERVNALKRLGDLAREREAEFVLVAGDLFDSIHPRDATVATALEAIGGMGVDVIAIPGNHDHGGPGGPWGQEFVRRQMKNLAPNFRVLQEAGPVELDTAVILPCPLVDKHTAVDPTSWLRDWEAAGGKPRVALAHGSVQGFSSTDEDEESVEHRPPNMIDLGRLPAGELDYIALGDWHGMKQVGDRVWYSGTPEPDRFPKGEDYKAGQALVVTADRGAQPEVEAVPVGGLSWVNVEFDFNEDRGPSQLEAQIDERLGGRGASFLMRLRLGGALNLSARARLEELLRAREALLLRLKLQDDTETAPDEAELAALVNRAEDPLISRVAWELSTMMLAGGEGGRTARAALIQLHAACSGDESCA